LCVLLRNHQWKKRLGGGDDDKRDTTGGPGSVREGGKGEKNEVSRHGTESTKAGQFTISEKPVSTPNRGEERKQGPGEVKTTPPWKPGRGGGTLKQSKLKSS